MTLVSASSNQPQVRLRDLYTKFLEKPDDHRLWKKYLWEGPSDTDVSSWQAQGYGVYQGKIRTVLSRDSRIQMLHSDRLTAFDRLIGFIPGKGAILTSISKWWFEQLSKDIPTHYLASPGPRFIVAEDCIPFKVEVVVRGYLAGAILRAYEKGERTYCGVAIPDGLKPFERLPEPIITPTTKAAAYEHDENVTVDRLISDGICTKSDWSMIEELSLKTFSLGSRIFDSHGWILVDTKYEFGRSPSGQIKLIDEVHTPDSSRLWITSSYEERMKNELVPEMLDKEIIRRWLIDKDFIGFGEVPDVPRELLVKLAVVYLNVAEALIGKPLEI
jgi:phosphoribosylaminoimidazole-succinocarboxamide synthase